MLLVLAVVVHLHEDGHGHVQAEVDEREQDAAQRAARTGGGSSASPTHAAQANRKRLCLHAAPLLPAPLTTHLLSPSTLSTGAPWGRLPLQRPEARGCRRTS